MTIQDIESTVAAAVKVEGDAVAAITTHATALPQIDVVNQSTVVSDADAILYVNAVQVQISRDFFPAWGLDCKLTFVPKGGTPNPSHWLMVIADTSDQAGALGYHSLSNTGNPIGFVFAKSDLDSGSSVSVTLSHEVLEMLADADINLIVQLDSTRFVAYESADSVEADSDGYQINGVQVSDFVLPSYFSPGHPGPWDFRKLLTGGMPALRPDGYLGVYVVGQGWTQVTAPTSPRMARKAIPYIGSRRQRRATPRTEWLNSEQ